MRFRGIITRKAKKIAKIKDQVGDEPDNSLRFIAGRGVVRIVAARPGQYRCEGRVPGEC